VTGKPITIYGDGKQVRDVLFIDDLINLYEAAIDHPDQSAGEVFNVGGGVQNTLSIWTEFGPMLSELLGREVLIGRGDWRPGDQRIYVSDIRKAQSRLDWSPKVGPAEGVRRLFEWVTANRELFA
jgi:CDP-paratose 2-epimerase